MSNLVKTLTSIPKKEGFADPLTFLSTAPLRRAADMVANNNPNNGVVSFLAPGARVQQRMDKGEGVTPKLLGDPGAFFAPTEQQQQQRRAAAAAAAIPMPLANEQELALARRRAAALQQQRGGRASTILTGTTDSLGG